jgi:hypothetical protein
MENPDPRTGRVMINETLRVLDSLVSFHGVHRELGDSFHDLAVRHLEVIREVVKQIDGGTVLPSTEEGGTT